MDSRGTLALSLVLVLVTAGCAGVVGQSGTTSPNDGLQPTETTTTETTTETTTTAETTTETTEEGEGDGPNLPPGLSEDDVVNAWRLASAHASALEETSFTVTRSESNWYENGTFAGQTASTTRVANGSTASVFNPHGVGETRVAEYATWSNGSAAVARTTWSNGSVDHEAVQPGQAQISGNPTDRDALYGLYSNLNLSVAGQVERNETTLFRLVSSGADEGPLANATVVVLVDGDGQVHEYHVSRLETTVQGTFHVDRTVRFTAVGETEVERPAWFDEVENASAA